MTDGSDHPDARATARLLRAWREHLAEDEEMAVDIDVDFSEYLEALRESLDSFVAVRPQGRPRRARPDRARVGRRGT